MALLAAATLILTAATPALAENSGGGGWVPPVANGNTPDPNQTTPPIGDPGAIRNDCIRIDFFPGFGTFYVLEFAYDIVIMSDGTANLVYFNPTPGDTLFGPGGPLAYVIKCGFGGFGNYAQGDVNVIVKPPVKPPVGPPVTGEDGDGGEGGNGDAVLRKLQFTLDGCQPNTTATVVVDGGPTQDFTIPASGVLTAYIVLPPDAPDPVRFTVTCNGYTTTVPVDDRSAEIVVSAGGLPETEGAVAPGAPGSSGGSGPSVAASNPLIIGEVASGITTADSLPAAPVAIAVNADAIAAAAATDGAKSITIAGQPGRSFSLGEIDLINPTTAEAAVAIVTGPDGVADYVIENAPALSEISSAAGELTGATGSGLPVARMALGGLAGLGLVAFALRRRAGRNRSVDTIAA